ncbi:probable apyrase 6 isoform X2 [Phalaenopsis equestris]|uniref:probable apyrase 6 isoform X2 n=1 Tax=Phalaenopsis equestris TaxID=78828 RepID=UPI0009E4E25A|nr:probable apyrase 6 isoform X2 [Phalaenopsis equestris]
MLSSSFLCLGSDSSQPYLPKNAMEAATKFPRRSSSAPRLFIFTRIPFVPFNRKQYHPTLWIFFSAAFAVLLFLYLLHSPKRIDPPRFSVVIDAGSTGTRLHVYGYTISLKTTLPVLDLASTSEMKVNPGLSSYSGDPASAGASLVPLLDFGKGKVPKDRWGDTEIRLMATAGLRMLDDGVRESILNSCRMVLTSSGFQFRDDWSSVISGSDEGVFAWVAANYALGMLGGDSQKTTGIIELGGASAQITFATSEALPSEFSHMVKFGGVTYNLYSNSFLGLGQNMAHESVKNLLTSKDLKSSEASPADMVYIDPCSPIGYSHSMMSPAVHFARPSSILEHQSIAHVSGNFSECKSVALMLLQKEKDRCIYQQCQLGSNYVPNLQGRFLATENFFFTSKFFGLGPMPSLSDFESAGQQFCEEDSMKLKRKYQTLKDEDFSSYCFSSAYIVALLHDQLGIGMTDKRLWFSNQVDNIQLDWALGAFIMKTMERMGWTASLSHDYFFTLLGIILLCSLLSFIIWVILRLRKPQLKTIYDLEKGHYIVTKVDAMVRRENCLQNQPTHFFFNSTPPPSPACTGIFNMDPSDYSSATDIDVDHDNTPQTTSFSYPSSPRATAANAAVALPGSDILPVSTGRMRRRSIIAKGMQKTLSKTSMLVNFLPTGTLLTFEMLLPSASGDGTCSPVSTAMIYILLAICALSCFFFHFTDSFRATDGKVYYGFVTPTGLALFKSGNLGADAGIEVPLDDRYVMRFVDLIHAGMSVLVFAAIALSDHRVTNCLMPGHRKEMDEFMESFPLMVGAVCSGLFLVFPNTRYGIGCMAA